MKQHKAVITITLDDPDDPEAMSSVAIDCDPPLPMNTPKGELKGIHAVVARFVDAVSPAIVPGSGRFE